MYNRYLNCFFWSETDKDGGIVIQNLEEQDLAKRYLINLVDDYSNHFGIMLTSDGMNLESLNLFYEYTYVNPLTHLLKKRTELQKIIEESSHVYQGYSYANGSNSPSSYTLRNRDGSFYVIDTRYPLQANPVRIFNSFKNEIFLSLNTKWTKEYYTNATEM